MPLTTEGIIEQLARFRSDKLALVALIGSMGNEDEKDALERLRSIRSIMADELKRIRNLPIADRRRAKDQERLIHDVWELATEVEPWLSQVVDKCK